MPLHKLGQKWYTAFQTARRYLRGEARAAWDNLRLWISLLRYRMTAIPRRKRLWQWFRPRAWTIVNLGIGISALGLTIWTGTYSFHQMAEITGQLSSINQDSQKTRDQIALITENVQRTAELLDTLTPLVYKTSIRTELQGGGGKAYLDRARQMALGVEPALAEKSVEKECVLTPAGKRILAVENLWDSVSSTVRDNPGYSPAEVALSVGVDALYDVSVQQKLNPDIVVGLVAILVGEIKVSGKQP